MATAGRKCTRSICSNVVGRWRSGIRRLILCRTRWKGGGGEGKGKGEGKGERTLSEQLAFETAQEVSDGREASLLEDKNIRDEVREMATDLMATSTTKLTLTLFHPIQFVWFVWLAWLASLCCPSLKMRSIAHEFRVRVLGICRRGTGRKLSRWGRSKEGWISPLRPCGRTGRLNCCHWGRAGGGGGEGGGGERERERERRGG